MAALQSSLLAKNASNLAAQLALVESRGREESMGKEKSDSRPSTGTVVSAAGDSIKGSVPSSKATSQPTSGHTSPPTVHDGSTATSPTASRPTTGHTSPQKMDGSISTSRTASQITTGHTSPTILEDTEAEGEGKAISQKPEDANAAQFEISGGTAGDKKFQGGSPTESEVLSTYSVAEAVEAFESKTTRKTKKSKKKNIDQPAEPNKIVVEPAMPDKVLLEQSEPNKVLLDEAERNKVLWEQVEPTILDEKGDLKGIFKTCHLRTLGWGKCSLLGLTLLGLCALICSYCYISECIIIIKLKQREPFQNNSR